MTWAGHRPDAATAVLKLVSGRWWRRKVRLTKGTGERTSDELASDPNADRYPDVRRDRDYLSRSLNALRYACDALRIKSACVDTSVSTQS